MAVQSVFFPAHLVAQAQRQAQSEPWAAAAAQAVVDAAAPWSTFSDEQLWDLMFAPTLRRSWMVWSSGYCPSCRQGVPMYQWQIDALHCPWKVTCPHCAEAFPKNDFAAFYRSGLDSAGVFRAERADRRLLVNGEHPDPADPRHSFGVDDGTGYRDDGHTWWFVAAYLIYGQWKQLIVAGIRTLAAAYVVSGDRGYAHRAAILLDRVADLYPGFDFKEQGVMYEGPAHAGYVSTWHDACEETREMAIAFDQIRGALADDADLVRFLSARARAAGLANLKACGADIERNIADGLLRHPLAHPDRIRTNYPRREIALAVLQTVLDWPANRDQVMAGVDALVAQATAVDGVTGEKGLAGYSAYVIHGLAQFVEQYARIDPAFLSDLLARHPQLARTWRFHIDTWCLEQYYPQCGDTGAFGRRCDQYMGAPFVAEPGLLPSMFSLFWRLYELTGDAAYVQVLYGANGHELTDLPRDLLAADPVAFRHRVAAVIETVGTELRLDSINLPDWHLAILRAGAGVDRRAVWLDYDAGGGHGHRDGLNLGLYARGMDLLPDFGYPPVQYGGWQGPRFTWYLMAAAHNTVVVDGRDQEHPAHGHPTLWGSGGVARAVAAAAPELYAIDRYERVVLMVDLSAADSYVLDLFVVAGGADHAKFVQGHFAQLTSSGLNLVAGDDFGHGTQMRHFRGDRQPASDWWADWRVDNRLGYLPPGTQVHLRYRDLTEAAEAWLAEAWVALHSSTYEDAWVPRVMVRRQAPPGMALTSTFVGLTEPYVDEPRVVGARRASITPQGRPAAPGDAAVEVCLADGRVDWVLAQDGAADRARLVVDGTGLVADARLALVRLDAQGAVTHLALWQGQHVSWGTTAIDLLEATDFAEFAWSGAGFQLAAGHGRLRP